jgi:flagellar motor protein MotB
MKKTLLTLSALLLAACASRQPTPELVDARIAYQRAEAGRAQELDPRAFDEARAALDVAERRQYDAPGSQNARDLAYIAERKALLAESSARTLEARAEAARSAPAPAPDSMALGAEKTSAAPLDPASARRAKEILDGVAAVSEEPRGMVVTLNAGTLFDGDAATVVPSARDRITEIAHAIQAVGKPNVTVITYDNHDTPTSTQTATDRATAVREALVGEGVPAESVHAEGRADPEHRADCRVEIVVQKP